MNRFFLILCSALLTTVRPGLADPFSPSLGPLYDSFGLTLEPGSRTEAVGPFFFSQQRDSESSFGVPPIFSRVEDTDVESVEFDLAYPIISYNRFGTEYRFQIFQWIAWAGGVDIGDTNTHRFNVFPFYFKQTSDNPDREYFALFPFYGTLKNRLFRDEISFVMWPMYVKTRRRASTAGYADQDFKALGYQFARERKSGVVTHNFLAPFFHVRLGEGLHGWQAWPIAGYEKKIVTTRTNDWNDVVSSPGHERRFILWPFYLDDYSDIGTENPVRSRALLPFYSTQRSPLRDSTTAPWPIGLTITDDRARKYREIGAPWPLIVHAEGEGKHTRRIWPFFSQSWNQTLRSDFYMWPVYKYNRFETEAQLRERTRILLFLYSKTVEKNKENGKLRRRNDCFPLFTYRQDWNGNQRLQILAISDPIIPNSKSMDRNYSPLWSVWLAQKNAQTGARSQSLLWNFYRQDTTPDSRKVSLLFGLFQYHSSPLGKQTRLFHIPLGRKPKVTNETAGGSAPEAN